MGLATSLREDRRCCNVDYSPTGITTPSLLTRVIIRFFRPPFEIRVRIDLSWEKLVMSKGRVE